MGVGFQPFQGHQTENRDGISDGRDPVFKLTG